MDKYLQQILLEVNTIIIPGLGALTVTNEKTGETMFMSYLKFDDGKLSAHIAEKEGLSENDAKNLIAKYVRDITAKLDQGQTYDMFRFGRFLKNKDGDVDFENWGSYANGENAPEAPLESEVPLSEDAQIADEISTKGDAELHDVQSEPAPETPLPEEVPLSESAQIADEISTKADDELHDVQSEPVPEAPLAEEVPLSETAQIADEISAKGDAELHDVQSDQDQEVPEEKTDEDRYNGPIADRVPTEENIQVENTYIPAEPVREPIIPAKPEEPVIPQAAPEIPKPEKPAPKPVQTEKQPTVEVKVQKKRSAGFWILITLIILILLGGIATVFFYDQIKTYLPFVKNERVEIQKETFEKEVPGTKATDEGEKEVHNNLGEKLTEETPEEAEEIQLPATQPAPAVENTIRTSTGIIDRNKPFHVIGGAFGVKENADRYAEKLKSSGNNSVIVGQFDNLYLVSIDSYSSQGEAQKALEGFTSITGKAWVFKWP